MSDFDKMRRLEQRVTNLEIALCALHSLSESYLAPDQERAVSMMMGEFYERSKSLGGFQCAGFEGAGFEGDDLLSALEALLRQAAQYVGMVKFWTGIGQSTTDEARNLLAEILLAEIEAVLATSQHKKDAGDA